MVRKSHPARARVLAAHRVLNVKAEYVLGLCQDSCTKPIELVHQTEEE